MSRRILLLITDLEIGGTPTVVRELATRLRRLPGVIVAVACLSNDKGTVAGQLRDAGVRVVALNGAGLRDLPRVVYGLVRLIRGFDTVFSFLVHANAVAAAASIFCPQVRFLQSIQTTQPEPRWHWRLQGWADFAADRIVVPSSSVAIMARQSTSIAARKIVVIANAIDPRDFPASPVPLADPRPYPIGFIGRLDPVKCIPDLLQAVAMLDGLVELHVFGQGADQGRTEGEIDRLGIGRLVRLHGAIDRPQAALGRIGMIVLPSSAEGFGLVLIEAMAARVPVVATNVPGIRDVVRQGKTGLLVPPRQPAALAEAIKRIVTDRPLRLRLIDTAAQDVQQRFNWDQVLAQYETVLKLQ